MKLKLRDEERCVALKYEVEIPRTTRGVAAWHAMVDINNIENHYERYMAKFKITSIVKPFKWTKLEKKEPNNHLKFSYGYDFKIEGDPTYDHTSVHDYALDAPVSSWNKQ